MKITRLSVERFGLWTDLDLPLAATGLSVLCGPNEAGKTTLLRFIRGVLFGFSPFEMQQEQSRPAFLSEAAKGPARPGHTILPGGGFLEVLQEEGEEDEAAATTRRIERRWDADGREHLSISGTAEATPSDRHMAEWLGVDRSVFEHVFALGLQELQQLAVLHRNEVAERCYDISLGPQGRILLQALRRTESARRKFLREQQTPEGRKAAGRLIDLLRQAEQLQDEWDTHIHLRDRYDQLCRSQTRLLDRIAELKSRQAGMEEQLRGHRFLERIFEPWQQVEEYRSALREIPEIDGFPAEGRQQLERLDEEIRSAQRCRKTLQQEIRERQQQLLRLRHKQPPRQTAAALRRWLGRGETVLRRQQHLRDLARTLEEQREQLERQMRQLGGRWTAEQLAGTTLSAEASRQLWEAGHSFLAARRRLHRFRRNYHRLSRRHRRLGHHLKTALEEADGQNAAQCFEAERTSWRRQQQRQYLQQRMAELEDRRQHLDQLLSARGDTFRLPGWFRVVLWSFFVVGGMAAAAGMAVAALVNALAGTILSLAGISALGIARGLKHRAERSFRRQSDLLNQQRQRLTEELAQRQQEWDQLTAGQREADFAEGAVCSDTSATAKPDTSANAKEEKTAVVQITADSLETSQALTDEERAALSEAALRAAAARCAHWQRLMRLEKRLQQGNRQRVQWRARFAERQRHYQAARQQWCQTLQQLGLPETLNVAEALQNWQHLVSAAESARRYRFLLRQQQRQEQRLQKWLRNLRQTAEAANIPVTDSAELSTLLNLCREASTGWNEARSQQKKLREEIATRRDAVRNNTQRLRELKEQRRTLLQEAGVNSRAEFEQKAALLVRRTELQELLELAEEELREAAETEPELAIVEEDLRQHDPEHNAGCIQMLQQELNDLQQDLNRAYEELGRMRQAVRELAENRSQSRLLRRRASLSRAFAEAALDRLTEEGLLMVLQRIRARYEAEHQPDVLREAGGLLEQLTGGRYPRLWTPLDQRRLFLDDVSGCSWSLDELSGGTREAVFLALRLALVRDYSRRGVHLPMILDDVLVNFDQSRAEAAAETLLQLAAEGQQILFLTCHQHIAELFARRGVSPCWLRGPAMPAPQRRAG